MLKLFDEIATSLLKYIDMIAERITALGGLAIRTSLKQQCLKMYFKAAGYRVIVPDQIGFNKSSNPDISYRFDMLATNTTKLLDALKVNQVVLVAFHVVVLAVSCCMHCSAALARACRTELSNLGQIYPKSSL